MRALYKTRVNICVLCIKHVEIRACSESNAWNLEGALCKTRAI